MPQPKDDLKPGVPITGMIREGSKEGPATVRFDSVRKQNFHLNLHGEAVFHEKPDGFRFDDDGILRPMKGTEEGESEEVIVDMHAGTPAEKEG